MIEFNGYSFSDKEMRKRMKYIIINDGDLDINNAYAFKSMKDLKEYIKETKNRWIGKTLAVFEVKDITTEIL